MNKRHMFITVENSATRFRTSDNCAGANPAKTIEDHFRNITEFLNGYTSNTVEFRLDIDKRFVTPFDQRGIQNATRRHMRDKRAS